MMWSAFAVCDAGNGISRLRYNTMYLERILARIEASAPPGADTTSWRAW
jgi:hypothetical protein